MNYHLKPISHTLSLTLVPIDNDIERIAGLQMTTQQGSQTEQKNPTFAN